MAIGVCRNSVRMSGSEPTRRSAGVALKGSQAADPPRVTKERQAIGRILAPRPAPLKATRFAAPAAALTDAAGALMHPHCRLRGECRFPSHMG
jgi:hypothetical protein